MNIKEYFKALRFSPAHHLGGGDIRITIGQQEQLEAELEAMTKERDAFRAEFCNGPAYDTRETPEQARARWDKQAFIEGVAAVIIAREAIKEREAEREKCEKLKHALVENDYYIMRAKCECTVKSDAGDIDRCRRCEILDLNNQTLNKAQ